MVFFDPLVEISLIAMAVVVISRAMQAKFIDKDKQKAAQARMKEKQTKIKELMKNEDEKSKNEMQRLQQEMMEEMSETMQGSMRYMMFSLPIFFGAFFVLRMFYENQVFATPFEVPTFSNFFFLNPFSWIPTGLAMETGWLRWYFLTYLATSISLGIIFKIRDIFAPKKE